MYIGAFVEPKTNNPHTLLCDACANKSGYLDRLGVLDVEINERAGGEIVGSGG